MLSCSLHGISVDLFIETGCFQVIAQSDYFNVTSSGSSMNLYPTCCRKSRLS